MFNPLVRSNVDTVQNDAAFRYQHGSLRTVVDLGSHLQLSIGA